MARSQFGTPASTEVFTSALFTLVIPRPQSSAHQRQTTWDHASDPGLRQYWPPNERRTVALHLHEAATAKEIDVFSRVKAILTRDGPLTQSHPSLALPGSCLIEASNGHECPRGPAS